MPELLKDVKISSCASFTHAYDAPAMHYPRTIVKRWGRFAWVNKHLDEFIGHRRIFGRLWRLEHPKRDPEPAEDMLEMARRDDAWWASEMGKVVAESRTAPSFYEQATELVVPMQIPMPDAYIMKGAETAIVGARCPR